MKKIFLTIALAISLFSSEYIVNKEHSSIKFEASKMLFIGVDGEFSDFNGLIDVNNNKLTKIDGIVSIDSINTKDKKRDEHLKVDDYFQMMKFPNIVFKSNAITDDIVKATLSIKGIKKDLSFKISELSVSNKNVTFKLTSTINRQEFMLNGSMSAIIANNVDVIASIVATKK
jgi:polyisoprenoid-binding protein YceI